ncbi:MAG: hypothetical protein WCO28_09440 [Bacteroidota bacterium]
MFSINCSTPAKQRSTPTIEQPRPVMELQVDSLKKVLDEKRKTKIKE